MSPADPSSIAALIQAAHFSVMQVLRDESGKVIAEEELVNSGTMFCTVTALKRTKEVIEYRGAGETNTAQKSPGLTRYDPITVARQLTEDKKFSEWAKIGPNDPIPPHAWGFRREIKISIFGNKLEFCYKVRNCWISEYTVAPIGLASAPTDPQHPLPILTESIKLENEGWELKINGRP